MYTVLLSGGSGKRLWPLSNDLRSKQYLKLTAMDAPPYESCSMVQRVWAQLAAAGFADKRLICASSGQLEIIRSQLGNVPVAVEPDRRDTFPAVALSCAYIKSELGAGDDDIVCMLPVDPYTEQGYFETAAALERTLIESGADIALMGAVPTEPSAQYGYIVPGEKAGGFLPVSQFREKPGEATARALIAQGALWNCGVFCFRLGYVLEAARAYGVPEDYRGMYAAYDRLPKRSFDYEVLEQAERLVVLPFEGHWADLGTWSALAEQMREPVSGQAFLHQCENTHAINELDIPLVVMNTKDLVIVAAWDGILVTDAAHAGQVKNVIGNMCLKAMYEERRWGTIKTVDITDSAEGFVLTRKILMFAGASSSYHFHREREEAVTVLRGRGEFLVEGVTTVISQGTTITIPRGKRHGFRAFEDLEFMEIHIGQTIGDEDINRLTFDWAEIEAVERGNQP